MTRHQAIEATMMRAAKSGLSPEQYAIDVYCLPLPLATRRRIDHYDTAAHNLRLAESRIPVAQRSWGT